MNGLICAGKKIHDVLIDAANVGVENVAGKYVQECQLMSDLRHPNITLFLGVCFLPDCQLPVLLMERLDGNLDDLIETVPKHPSSVEAIHSGRRVQGPSLPAQTHSSNYPQGPDGKECAADLLFRG